VLASDRRSDSKQVKKMIGSDRGNLTLKCCKSTRGDLTLSSLVIDTIRPPLSDNKTDKFRSSSAKSYSL